MSGDQTYPVEFDAQFLDWFRERTESAWAALPTMTSQEILAGYVENGAGGSEFQRGSRWLGGMSEEQIAQIERTQRLTFPPEYHLFLRQLHTLDRPMLTAGYLAFEERLEDQQGILASAYVDEAEQYMVLEEYNGGGFHNWLTDSPDMAVQPAALWEGLQFDIEYNNLWLADWGSKPTSLEGCKERVRELVETAPKLLRVIGHRYLLAEPAIPGNPVFSIVQSDMVVYGPNLHDFLLFEFADTLGLTRRNIEREVMRGARARQDDYAAIPFWGSFFKR